MTPNPDQFPARSLAHRPLERGEQGGVGLRIVKCLARRIQRGDAEFGQEEADRPVHAVQPFADPPADPLVLRRGCTHERDLRIMRVQKPSLVSRWHGVGGTEIDHVKCADRADIGRPRADDRAEPVLVGRQDAARQHIGDLGRGDVDDGGDEA